MIAVLLLLFGIALLAMAVFAWPVLYASLRQTYPDSAFFRSESKARWSSLLAGVVIAAAGGLMALTAPKEGAEHRPAAAQSDRPTPPPWQPTTGLPGVTSPTSGGLTVAEPGPTPGFATSPWLATPEMPSFISHIPGAPPVPATGTSQGASTSSRGPETYNGLSDLERETLRMQAAPQMHHEDRNNPYRVKGSPGYR